MNIKCENCGALYEGPISSYQRFVKCKYCNSIIVVKPSGPKQKELIVREVVIEPSKTFEIHEFANFLVKRGIKTFDSVSGVLRLGNQQVYVSEEGAVEGSEPLKSRVDKWVHIFMSQS